MVTKFYCVSKSLNERHSIYSALYRQYLLLMSNTYRGTPWSTKHHKNKFCALKHTKDLQKYLLLALTPIGRPKEIRI